MVSDCAQSHGCITMHHSTCCIVFHNLILHQRQFLRHLHWFMLVAQHTLTHFIYDQLSTSNIFSGSYQVCFKSLYFTLLPVLERFKLVFLLDGSVTGFSHLIKLTACSINLLSMLLSCFCFLFLTRPHLMRQGLFSLTSGCLEIFKFFLGFFNFTHKLSFHICNLLFTTSDSRL